MTTEQPLQRQWHSAPQPHAPNTSRPVVRTSAVHQATRHHSIEAMDIHQATSTIEGKDINHHDHQEASTIKGTMHHHNQPQPWKDAAMNNHAINYQGYPSENLRHPRPDMRERVLAAIFYPEKADPIRKTRKAVPVPTAPGVVTPILLLGVATSFLYPNTQIKGEKDMTSSRMQEIETLKKDIEAHGQRLAAMRQEIHNSAFNQAQPDEKCQVDADEKLAEEIFQSSARHRPTAQNDLENISDEDSRLAQEIFDAADGTVTDSESALEDATTDEDARIAEEIFQAAGGRSH